MVLSFKQVDKLIYEYQTQHPQELGHHVLYKIDYKEKSILFL